MNEKILTVSELTDLIKKELETRFPRLLLEGEMSNVKLHTSGHLYFSLKDEGAQIACVMYRSSVEKLSQLPKEGDHVVVKGNISVYPPSGRYQITVLSIQPKGLGALLQKLEELKKKLKEKGYFDSSRKKALPKFPKTIGVITSPTGAVIRDIVRVLEKRVVNFHLILYPVKVQGEGAKEEIARAIEDMNRYQLADVLIVGRGGGSIEDLWAFNEELVADAIFKSKIPIISAVGHETDFTIADFVADQRAPTPSAAAEMVCQEKISLLQQLLHLEKRMGVVEERIKKEREVLKRLINQPMFHSADHILGIRWQKIDEQKGKLDRVIEKNILNKKIFIQKSFSLIQEFNPINLFKQKKERLSSLSRQLEEKCRINHLLYTKKVEKFSSLIEYLNPQNILSKGYSILFSQNGSSVISSVDLVDDGDPLLVQLKDGSLQVLAQKKVLDGEESRV